MLQNVVSVDIYFPPGEHFLKAFFFQVHCNISIPLKCPHSEHCSILQQNCKMLIQELQGQACSVLDHT